MRAAEYGHTDCLRLLIDAGANINAQEQAVRVFCRINAAFVAFFTFWVGDNYSCSSRLLNCMKNVYMRRNSRVNDDGQNSRADE